MKRHCFLFLLLSLICNVIVAQTNCEVARKAYLDKYPDVKANGADPWTHYNLYGKNEGRIWPPCSNDLNKNTKSKPARSKSSNTDVITTYSGAYGLTGVELDQPEIVFNLETTYPNSRFTQLYRWRYALGEFTGLIFEYNNRIYFGKNRDYDNSKWFLQGKVGYGMLKGRTYAPYTVSYFDPVNLTYGYNTSTLSDNRHFIIDFGLSLGYKFILSDRFTLDFGVGYSGYTKPKYEIESNTFRLDKWREGIGSPLEVLWSVGFFLD